MKGGEDVCHQVMGLVRQVEARGQDVEGWRGADEVAWAGSGPR